MVPIQHLDVGKQVMTDRHGLSPLEMGVPRQEDILVRLGKPDKGGLQRPDTRMKEGYLITKIEAQIGSHLIIATSCRVEFGSGFTDPTGQLLFDIHVNILEINREWEFTPFNLTGDFIQSTLYGIKLGRGDEPGIPESSGMSDTPDDIVVVQSPVKGYGFPVISEQCRHGFLKTAVAHS
jgi:hypothetical protein